MDHELASSAVTSLELYAGGRRPQIWPLTKSEAMGEHEQASSAVTGLEWYAGSVNPDLRLFSQSEPKPMEWCPASSGRAKPSRARTLKVVL